jgi:hypothetical protein
MSRKKQGKFRPISDKALTSAMGYTDRLDIPSEYSWIKPCTCFSRLSESDLQEGDDLLSNPRCPMQSLKEFQKSEDLRFPSPKQRTIYLVGIGELDHLPFAMGSIAAYLAAFYQGMQVKIWKDFNVVLWHQAKRVHVASTTPVSFVGLQSDTGIGRVRIRDAPDGHALKQLNAFDIIDMLIEEMKMLPDAYCVLGVTAYDMYESEEDMFIAGRAFGGNGCAVVSCARYSPDLAPNVPEWKCDEHRLEGAAVPSAAEGHSSSRALDEKAWLARVCKLHRMSWDTALGWTTAQCFTASCRVLRQFTKTSDNHLFCVRSNWSSCAFCLHGLVKT